MDDEQELQSYSNRVDEIYGKWSQTNFLNGLTETRAKKMAVILDNEKLFAETQESPFREAAVPLVHQIFQDFIPFDLVNVCPMIRPAGRISYQSHKRCEEGQKVVLSPFSERVFANPKRLSIHFSKDEYEKPYLARNIRNEMTREILRDLSNNVGTISRDSTPLEDLDFDKIFVNIVQASDFIHRKTLRGTANWIVTGPTLGKKLFPEMSEVSDPAYVGTICCAWKLFVDPAFNHNELLIGRHVDEEQLGSYFYCPYVPVIPLAGPVGSPLDYSVMSRHGKRLPTYGSGFFSKIVFEGT